MKRLRAISSLIGIVLVAGLPFASLAASPPWGEVRTVGSGLGVQITGRYADEETLARIRKTGFGFVRFSLGWESFEREKGSYDWHESDELIARVRAQGLRMVIPMLGGNALYDGRIMAPQPNTDHVRTRPRAPQTPESREAYARFVTQAVLRYGTQDIVWEIWNEPDLARFWPPRPEAASFAVLAETTCRMVKSVVPSAFVVGPSLARVPDPQDGVTSAYFDTFLSSGAARCLDAISVHPYRHGREAPEAAFRDYATLFDRMARHKVYRPLINTEWGYTTTQVTPEEQASYALRARLTDMIWGIPLSVWYEWQDSRDDAADPEGHFGLMTYDRTEKPAVKAAAAFWPRIRSSALEQQVPTLDPHNVVLQLRDPDGLRILVGWTLRRRPVPVILLSDEVPAQATLGPVPAVLASGRTVGIRFPDEEDRKP